jgi:hypothetical protein
MISKSQDKYGDRRDRPRRLLSKLTVTARLLSIDNRGLAHPFRPTQSRLPYPAPKTREFEHVIMTAVGIEEMAGSDCLGSA